MNKLKCPKCERKWHTRKVEAQCSRCGSFARIKGAEVEWLLQDELLRVEVNPKPNKETT